MGGLSRGGSGAGSEEMLRRESPPAGEGCASGNMPGYCDGPKMMDMAMEMDQTQLNAAPARMLSERIGPTNEFKRMRGCEQLQQFTPPGLELLQAPMHFSVPLPHDNRIHAIGEGNQQPRSAMVRCKSQGSGIVPRKQQSLWDKTSFPVQKHRQQAAWDAHSQDSIQASVEDLQPLQKHQLFRRPTM